ncbi:MAG: hypothetical protein IIX25_04460 [Clostridia bacterium]|nr:hypothetical protein [Clostridia bacterium]
MKAVKKSSDIIFLLLIFIMIFGMGTAILLKPQKSFSERENRSLQKLPSLSWRSVLSGDFSRLLGDFYSDQLPFREELGTIYSISELSLGKRECNGVFVGEGGVLVDLAKKQSQDREILNVNLSSAKALQGRNGAVCFWVPRSSDAFGERLPDALRELSSKDVESVDCQLTERMISEISRCKTPEEHYYRTDHHWTTKGAYTAYLLLSKELGYEPYDESFFRVETVATNFLGTSFQKVRYPRVRQSRTEFFSTDITATATCRLPTDQARQRCADCTTSRRLTAMTSTVFFSEVITLTSRYRSPHEAMKGARSCCC